MTGPDAAGRLRRARWALLYGNFAIGCGVTVVGGTLNDLSASFHKPVAVMGQLIAVAAAVMCIGAPLLAWLTSSFDRRRLLTAALVWYAAGHALCTLAPDPISLGVLRGLTVLGAAVVTPQAAAAIGLMSPPAQRARSVAFVFLGWSMAFVLGSPMALYLSETFSWHVAFLVVSTLSATGALAVHAALPRGLKSAPLSVQAWKAALTSPILVAVVAVSALQAAGQFTQAAYLAPYYKQVLHTSPIEASFLFGWFGALGILGNLALVRIVGRVGFDGAVLALIALMAASLLCWPLATDVVSMALVIAPWALACFATNSAQQARLTHLAFGLAPALMALNTSAIYLGQAVGAAGGGWLLSHSGFSVLHWGGLAWMACAVALGIWVRRRSADIKGVYAAN